MKRLISVGNPAQSKLGCTIILVSGFVVAVILCTANAISHKSLEPLAGIGVFAVLLSIIYYANGKVGMRVQIDEHFLYVWNGKKEAQIPFSDIKNVYETSGGKYAVVPDILVTLKSRSPFGKSVQFKPIEPTDVFEDLSVEVLKPRPLLARLYQRHPIGDLLRSKMQSVNWVKKANNKIK